MVLNSWRSGTVVASKLALGAYSNAVAVAVASFRQKTR